MDEKEEKLNTISELGREAFDSKEGQDSSGTEPETLEEMKQSLVAKAEEIKALQDKYLRLAAEFDNYKRLSQREQRDYTRFANEGILKELLPILDNLERAVRSSTSKQGRDGLVQGVELTLKQFTEALAKFGVRLIASIGQAFDPACHEAVARVESNTVPAGSVVDEFQRGYYLHDRVLRPAMVTVSTTENADQGPASQGPQESPSGAPN
ncbi:MAG TPA: nucleotide exchange factor GrpE [Nitrospiraceae bacterium]|nr:nucleotide exchange factor GrpE [Nitrospiraceae bacterium]